MPNSAQSIHPTALVASNKIGTGTRVWAFVNIQDKVEIGEDCNIGDHCFVESGVFIGNRVTVKNGVSLWDGLLIEDDVFIGPGAVFTNDIYPRSKRYHVQPVKTIIHKGASIGANAVIVAGNRIGRYAMIGAGAVVTCDIPDFTLWYGNPARFTSHICKCGEKLKTSTESSTCNGVDISCECGARFILSDKLQELPREQ